MPSLYLWLKATKAVFGVRFAWQASMASGLSGPWLDPTRFSQLLPVLLSPLPPFELLWGSAMRRSISSVSIARS